MKKKASSRHKITRINGELHNVVPVEDEEGKILHHATLPLRVELKMKDVLQIIVGSTILAVPVVYTEEVWNLGEQLSWLNTIMLSLVGIIFISLFVRFDAYKGHFQLFRSEFTKRVLSIFLLSLLVVGVLLTIVGKGPWVANFGVALKRTLIAAFPASMSATVTDTLS
jgi:uncharacterized membrane protein